MCDIVPYWTVLLGDQTVMGEKYFQDLTNTLVLIDNSMKILCEE